MLLLRSLQVRAISDTLIVVAAYDRAFYDHLPEFRLTGLDTLVVDTSAGGWPNEAFKRVYRTCRYDSYLFLQDSLRPNVDDFVQPFTKVGRQVVAWGLFPLFFDDLSQAEWVLGQYPGTKRTSWTDPEFGIFGPIFYATRRALDKVSSLRLFPQEPTNFMEAQGTERAWAFAFHQAGIQVGSLGGMTTDGVRPNLFPEDKTFTKTFGGRT